MLSDELIARAAALSSATLHEAAGKRGALPPTIKPLASHVTVCGRAFPVKSPAGDNLWLHRAIYAAAAGDVLVADCSGGLEFGYWGEVMAVAAQVRGLAGLVTTGGVRDSERMVAMNFPTFAAQIAIKGTGKNPAGRGTIGEAITIGDIDVERGDLVLGDADGVVVLPAADAQAAIKLSEERDLAEQAIFERLRAGDTTIEIYNLPLEAS